MARVSLRRLLSKLTALALTTSSVGPALAADPAREIDEDEDLAAELAIDREQVSPADAAHALGRNLALALTELRPLRATHLVTTWSLSDDPVRRLAIARSLEWTFPLVGDALVIDHLSRDADPAIRAAAARAAWVRRASGGDLGVLARLADDPDPAVRSAVALARG